MNTAFTGFLIAAGVCIIFCIIRGALGPRFTDRLVCANLINTKIIAIIIIFGIYLKEEFVLDTALVYSMIGFVAVTVLGKMFAGKGRYRTPSDIKETKITIDTTSKEKNDDRVY